MIIMASFLCLCILIYIYFELSYGLKKIAVLKKTDEAPKILESEVPLVSIVLVAKDEEKNIAKSLLSLVKQDYLNYEVIVVNDRSIDNTKNILKQYAFQHKLIHIIDIEKLPEGWLGKNHAMYVGAKNANGEWLLFADADVCFAENTLSLAMDYIQKNKIQNLTLMPKLQGQNFWLDMMISSGAIAFYLKQKPWRAKSVSKSYYAGVGAFNLLRKEDYWRFRGHASFPLCTLDDLKLAKNLKQLGIEQHCLEGRELVSVKWYDSVKSMVSGIEKNGFTYCDFKLLKLLKETLLGLWLYIWPLAGLFNHNVLVQLLCLCCILVTMQLYNFYTGFKKLSRWQILAYPFGVLMGLYACWQSAIKAIINKGIYWRNTFYPLEKLKKDLL